jgi:hypothetical protein
MNSDLLDIQRNAMEDLQGAVVFAALLQADMGHTVRLPPKSSQLRLRLFPPWAVRRICLKHVHRLRLGIRDQAEGIPYLDIGGRALDGQTEFVSLFGFGDKLVTFPIDNARPHLGQRLVADVHLRLGNIAESGKGPCRLCLREAGSHNNNPGEHDSTDE